MGSLGHPSEGETGLIYMRARYMDPAVGRFISEDPAADGNNWFTYGENDPTQNVDRDGRKADPVEYVFAYLVMQAGVDLITSGQMNIIFANGLMANTLRKSLGMDASTSCSLLGLLAFGSNEAKSKLEQSAAGAFGIAGAKQIALGITLKYIGVGMMIDAFDGDIVDAYKNWKGPPGLPD